MNIIICYGERKWEETITEYVDYTEENDISKNLILLDLKGRKSYNYLNKEIKNSFRIKDMLTFVDDELKHEVFLNPKYNLYAEILADGILNLKEEENVEILFNYYKMFLKDIQKDFKDSITYL